MMHLFRRRRTLTWRMRCRRVQRDQADYLLAKPAMRHAYCWRTGKRICR